MKDQKNRTETGQNTTVRQGKDDVRYWKSRLKKRSYLHDGQRIFVAEWQIRLTQSGKEVWFNLGTPNKDRAASKAREIYLCVKANGLAAAIQKFKIKDVPVVRAPTIGEYIELIRQSAVLSPKTLACYCRKFRTISAGILEMRGDPGRRPHREKYDSLKGGVAKWRNRIENRRLSIITPDKVQQWAKNYVQTHGTDPLKRKRAEHTVNSLIRNSRSLFSAKILKALPPCDFPSPLPFEGVELFSAGSMRYHSQINPVELLNAARNELATDRPEQYKAFVLCLLVGLRRREADLLLWNSVLWEKKVIRIERNKFFNPKREYSLGDIPVETELLAVLREYYERRKGPFVLESPIQPRPDAVYEHYRANRHLEGLVKWLRGKGVDTISPIHTLRKEFGRLINENYGIFAASRLLRHGAIGITAAHYADDTRKLFSGLGHLLQNEGGTKEKQDGGVEVPARDEVFVVDFANASSLTRR